MRAIAFANRLCRDLDVTSFMELTADIRQEVLDAINGGIQRLHALSPSQAKTTTGSIYLDAPLTVSLGVTAGSVEVTGYEFLANQLYRTIRVDGDGIDNQIINANSMLHPYGGATGTVSATIYSDGVAIAEPYDELVGDPTILETGRELVNRKFYFRLWRDKQVAEPLTYWLEANARNQNPPAPSVIRFNTLPDQAYRMEAQFTLAPARVSFTDLLSSGADIPLRAELVESYLLPISRSLMTTCRIWKDKDTKSTVNTTAEDAEKKFEVLMPTTLATPRNFALTTPGF